jgi:2-iminobutanoate/2-iminopropanoate deaminase
VRVGDVLYLSGALGNVPGKMELVPGGIEAETRQTMANIAAVLHARNLTFDDVFKCTAMLADMKEWPAFNAVYLTYFKPDRLPARSAFGASGIALGARVELECWAYVG